MLQTEFLRSVHANYERVLLEEKPEEKKYQYCILNRGGIKGLLPCSLRYINGLAYLYYDITSRQSVAQVYADKSIGREWVKDFLWSLRQIELELSRFLLDLRNVIWYPEHIFQELDRSIFSFMYIPYYQGEDSFRGLLEFLIDHIDYEDEVLVDTVYKMYDHYEKLGYDYLQTHIFTDSETLEQEVCEIPDKVKENHLIPEKQEEEITEPMEENEEEKQEKRGILSIFDGKKKKTKAEKSVYQKELRLSMSGYEPFASRVAEEDEYTEEYGQTIFISDTEEKNTLRRLYTSGGQILVQLENPSYVIGKKKDEVDVVLEETSISRMHARILREQDAYFIEDLNSTNGTFKNNLRMQPYEKRRLEEGDEIRLGKVTLMFR